MQKKYVVRLTAEECEELSAVVRKFKGTSQKVRRAQILLKADADGPNWTDARIAEAFGVRTNTVENVRKRLVERGFAETLHGVKPQPRPDAKVLDGEAEARVIALRLGPPPPGYANWSLRLLARRVVELALVDAVSHETLRQTLKKTGWPAARSNTGSFRRKPTESSPRLWRTLWTFTRCRTTQPVRCWEWMNNQCSC